MWNEQLLTIAFVCNEPCRVHRTRMGRCWLWCDDRKCDGGGDGGSERVNSAHGLVRCIRKVCKCASIFCVFFKKVKGNDRNNYFGDVWLVFVRPSHDDRSQDKGRTYVYTKEIGTVMCTVLCFAQRGIPYVCGFVFGIFDDGHLIHRLNAHWMICVLCF